MNTKERKKIGNFRVEKYENGTLLEIDTFNSSRLNLVLTRDFGSQIEKHT